MKTEEKEKSNSLKMTISDPELVQKIRESGIESLSKEGFTNRVLENKKGLNRDEIKYIAIVAMLANHFAAIFLNSGTLSQIPYCMAFTKQGVISFTGFNMLFTLLLCFLICLIVEKVPNIIMKIVLIIMIFICSMKCDWGIGAPVFTLLFIWSKNSILKKKIAFVIPTVLFGLYNFIGCHGKVPIVTCILSALICMIGMGMSGICIIYFYNGKIAKIGKSFSKWFFYIFYPLHLLIFALIRILA